MSGKQADIPTCTCAARPFQREALGARPLCVPPVRSTGYDKAGTSVSAYAKRHGDAAFTGFQTETSITYGKP